MVCRFGSCRKGPGIYFKSKNAFLSHILAVVIHLWSDSFHLRGGCDLKSKVFHPKKFEFFLMKYVPDTQPVGPGHCVKSFLAFLLMSMLFNQALSRPVSSFTLPRLTIRGESGLASTIGTSPVPNKMDRSVELFSNLRKTSCCVMVVFSLFHCSWLKFSTLLPSSCASFGVLASLMLSAVCWSLNRSTFAYCI